MCAKVVPILFQLADKFGKRRLTVKITREEKRCFDAVSFERLPDMIPTIAKRITRQDNRNIALRCVPANDRSVTIGQRFFFAGASVSFAAKR